MTPPTAGMPAVSVQRQTATKQETLIAMLRAEIVAATGWAVLRLLLL